MTDQFVVAVVDDDPRLRQLILEELTDEGVTPIPCETGQHLLDLLQTQTVDLVFLDLMMPGMDGFQCLAELRKQSVPVPVIVVTALNDEINRQKVHDLGAVDYILKPDLFEHLPELLDQHLPGPRNVINRGQPLESEG